MKYLLVTCHDYKGGEIGEIEIYNSIIECLNSIHNDIGENFEEYIQNKKELIENSSIYAGGDGYCFKIKPIKNYKLQDELDNEQLLDVINKITINEYEVIKQKYYDI